MILRRQNANRLLSQRSWTWQELSFDTSKWVRSIRSPSLYTIRYNQTQAQIAPFLTIEKCPSPTCACGKTPNGLDIDHEKPLNGTMAAHAQHLLVSTGRDDWASRIEDEEQGTFVRDLKSRLGPRGKFSDPYHNVMISNSSFSPMSPGNSHTASALLLPSFHRIEAIVEEDQNIDDFIRGYLLPTRLHSSYDTIPADQRRHLIHDPISQARFVNVTQEVKDILVLICGHGGRDERCGIMGPLLRAEFVTQLGDSKFLVSSDLAKSGVETSSDDTQRAVVGLISHIGGHKFAGNVIIYIPPSMSRHPLAGKGIWYGRVQPSHVEGIVEETIKNGIVIRELFRGGLGSGGEILRL